MIAFPLNALAVGDLWGEKSIDPDMQKATQSTELHTDSDGEQALNKEEKIIKEIELYGVNALDPTDILQKMLLRPWGLAKLVVLFFCVLLSTELKLGNILQIKLNKLFLVRHLAEKNLFKNM